MNKVSPIRDKSKIKEMKAELLKRSYRDYLLFVVGINTGLRISDILKLKVEDVKDKTHIEIKEKKTEKEKKFLINSKLQEELNKYMLNMEDHEFLFQSQKGTNKAISRVQAYRILRAAADKIKGLKDVKIGTHTLRKTFGYHHYQRNKDVALLQELFNHSSPSVTLEYIGINQDVMDKTIEDFYL
ncbi:site-specific integrase [Natroniella acetigena]|uniref:site-specific integrase n=1 Tax=Natroniella acetigena TaxID=52004 RepID=UPI00200AB72A|nr:site-specific integrase [Natroniella acetigena]MCK8828139.1 site-specific integrase [Natroniella acetigena]